MWGVRRWRGGSSSPTPRVCGLGCAGKRHGGREDNPLQLSLHRRLVKLYIFSGGSHLLLDMLLTGTQQTFCKSSPNKFMLRSTIYSQKRYIANIYIYIYIHAINLERGKNIYLPSVKSETFTSLLATSSVLAFGMPV